MLPNLVSTWAEIILRNNQVAKTLKCGHHSAPRAIKRKHLHAPCQVLYMYIDIVQVQQSMGSKRQGTSRP